MEKVNANNLTSLALSFFTGSSSVKNQSDNSFQNFLEQADSAKETDFSSQKSSSENKTKKSDSTSKKDKTDNSKKTDSASNDNSVSNDYNKVSDSSESSADENVSQTEEKTQTAEINAAAETAETDEKVEANDVSETDTQQVQTEEISENVIAETADVSDEADEIGKKEKEVIEKIAEITGLSTEEVSNILSEMGISALQLSDKQTLVDFMQEAFDVESPIELISIDGVKEMMESISEEVDQAVSDLGLELENINEIFDEAMSDKITEKADDRFHDRVDGSENQEAEIQTQIPESSEATQMESGAFNMSEQGGGLFGGNNQFAGQNPNELQGINVNGVVMDNIGKALNEVMTRAESTRNVDSSEVIRQIIDKIKLEGTEGQVNEIKITLKPDYLGEVALKISSENGIITAQFTAESQRVKEIIEANFEQLKESLAEQGIEVGQLEVNVGGSDENPSGDFSNANQDRGFGNSGEPLGDISAAEDEEEIVGYVGEDEVVEANVSYMA